MGAENRKHRRVFMRQWAEMSCRSEDSVITETVHITDISLGGAKVTAGRAFPPASIVKLQIPLPDSAITLIGSIRHVAEQTDPASFELGIKFIGLDDDELDRLRSVLLSAQSPLEKQ